MAKHIDLTGKKYGKLTVLYLDKKTKKQKGTGYEYHWMCKCECKNSKSILGQNLRNGWTNSCGCLTKPTDITGNKYGKLTVINFDKEIKNKKGISKYYWNCICECGKTKSVYVNYLRSGKKVSCGCSKQIIDLTGKKYGKLKVINIENKKKGKYYWKCLCDCGNEIITSGNALKSRNSMSCGCLRKKRAHSARFINLTRQKYGKLEVLEYKGEKHGHSLWFCQCECGNQKIISGYNLRKGLSKSCGCRKGRFTHGLSTHPDYKKWMRSDPVRHLRHNVSCLVRIALQDNNGSKKGESIFKHLPYTIDQLKEHLESQFEPWMSWDSYGGKSDNPEQTWHLDHIIPQDNFKYTSMEDEQFQECWALKNLRPLEKIKNMSKGNRIIQENL